VKFLTKKELADEVAANVKISKKDAAMAVDAVLEGITGALKKGKRKARTGINPQTKEAIKIPASKSPAFSPGKGLKDAIAKKK
jgi:DNA-binding protein HU-beta